VGIGGAKRDPGGWDRIDAEDADAKAWARPRTSTRSSNPSKPPREAYWGARTVDEMEHAAILYTFDDEQLTQGQ
jgi:hypothetical protein